MNTAGWLLLMGQLGEAREVVEEALDAERLKHGRATHVSQALIDDAVLLYRAECVARQWAMWDQTT